MSVFQVCDNLSLHISLLPIACIIHNVKIDCVAPQDVNTRVTWGAFIAKICMVPGHNLVPAQCSGLGTRLRGRRPRDEKPQQYTVHAQCSLRMLTRKTE